MVTGVNSVPVSPGVTAEDRGRELRPWTKDDVIRLVFRRKEGLALPATVRRGTEGHLEDILRHSGEYYGISRDRSSTLEGYDGKESDDKDAPSSDEAAGLTGAAQRCPERHTSAGK
ncbi:Hypp954 [Branchiostoma lanceolatum]|uniref:Hypp954 protein n=1 Tax=Branchiostoma lanceolatum TaxID=7740 RepID=A0A8K0ELF8_BRALA|nr:Hypp954 [Branchiostoma lanceolatum]